ncbi:MAG: transketolase [Candidatus Woesearchaeota archaeon]|nr:transketolase [Candidatus Woesearchaeota archaeon]
MQKTTDIEELKKISNEIRSDVIKMVANAASGHAGGPLGLADIFAVLYFNVLNHDPKNPMWKDRDRLILSNGHVCAVRYAAMAESGYFKKDELMTFRKLHTRLQGHPSRLDFPEMESSTGSLAQGLSVAIGMALAAKLDKKEYRIYCSLGDGECEEGQIWEAAMAASHYKLDNLIAFVDRNYLQISGDTEDIIGLDPLHEKFKAFGWNVLNANGHELEQIMNAFEEAKKTKEKPTVIIFRTMMGKGVSFMENKHEWHGKPPTKEQAEIALKELSKNEKI